MLPSFANFSENTLQQQTCLYDIENDCLNKIYSPISVHAAFQDYIPVSELLELNADRRNATVNITIVNDAITEQNELFLVGLRLLQREEEGEAPRVILEPQYAGVLILDDDGGLWSGSVCVHVHVTCI